MNLYSLSKIISKKILPEFLLRTIKRGHYQSVIRKFAIEKEPDLSVVKSLVENGDCVIDIGANIGVYTKFLSEFVGNDGTVYSIEPVPLTFTFLQNNINKLNLKNVSSLNYAISNNDGHIKMEIPSKIAGENFFRARIIHEDSKTKKKQFLVKSIMLDALLLNKLEKLSFIKCDVEGHELYALEGAKKILTKFKPSLLLEVEGDPLVEGTSAFKVFELLSSIDYEPLFLKNNKLIRWVKGALSINYFFLQAEHISRLKRKELII